MDRGAWWAIVHKVRIAQNQTPLKRLSNRLCRVQETLRFFFSFTKKNQDLPGSRDFPGHSEFKAPLSMQGTWVQSLVGGLRSYIPHDAARKIKEKQNKTWLECCDFNCANYREKKTEKVSA